DPVLPRIAHTLDQADTVREAPVEPAAAGLGLVRPGSGAPVPTTPRSSAGRSATTRRAPELREVRPPAARPRAGTFSAVNRAGAAARPRSARPRAAPAPRPSTTG